MNHYNILFGNPRKLYVESKLLHPGNISQAALNRQFRRHLREQVQRQFSRQPEPFSKYAPLLHYEMRGTGFSKEKIRKIKEEFIKICMDKEFELERAAGFDYSANISIAGYDDPLHPIIN